MTRKKKSEPKHRPEIQLAGHATAEKPAAGQLWIAPNLNRTISGAGGNRGDHTTSAARLLKLAEIALKRGA
jgi:hypothetical protein